MSIQTAFEDSLRGRRRATGRNRADQSPGGTAGTVAQWSPCFSLVYTCARDHAVGGGYKLSAGSIYISPVPNGIPIIVRTSCNHLRTYKYVGARFVNRRNGRRNYNGTLSFVDTASHADVVIL